MSLLVANGHKEHGVYKNQTGQGSSIFSLSVEAWTLIESFDPESHNCVTECGQFSLRIQGTQVSIFKCVSTSVSWFAKHNEVFTLTLGVDISSAEIPRLQNTSMPFVAFLLHQTNNTRSLFDAYTSIGQERPRNPSIAFKIAKGNLGWNSQSYKQIDDLLRTGYISFCYLDDAAIGNRWKGLMSACNDSQGAKSSTQSVNLKLSHSSYMDIDDEDTGRNNADANQSVQSRPPEFNLKAKAKRGRVVMASSPRMGTKKQKLSCVNPTNFARSEDVFSSNQTQRQATISQTTQGLLPIRTWVSGTKLVDSSSSGAEPQYWFRVRGSYVSILNGSPAIGTLLFEFELCADIESVELPHDHDVAVGFPLVILTLRETERTEHFMKKNTTFDRKRPIVGIKLSSSHSEWSLTSYKEIVLLIKASKVDVRSLNASGVRTRWQTLTRFQGSQAVPCSAYTSSPQASPSKNRPKPRPTYVGAEDHATLPSSERNSERQVVKGSNDAKSERDGVMASSGQSTTEPPIGEKARTSSAVVHNPPVIGDATTGSSQRGPGIMRDPMSLAPSQGHVTELITDSASSEKCLGTLSDFLSRNHQEVKEILEQALDLLDNGEP